MADLYLLYESASGYALMQKLDFEEIGAEEDQVQEAIADAKRFSKVCKFRAFLPFATAEDALEEVNAVCEGRATEKLMSFLEMNLPKAKSVAKAKYQLGVADPELGRSLAEQFPAATNDIIREMLRGVRAHFSVLVKDLTLVDLDKARLGLAHSYSRTKMQLDPNRQDKPIINAIALLDGLDKNINTFAMRVKEWYAWHFPELTKIVTDNEVYCRTLCHIGIRDSFDVDGGLEGLAEVCGSEEIAEAVVKALNMSMGQDIAEIDWSNIERWAKQVLALSEMRTALSEYLTKKLDVVAPNLKTLIGERVAARLISHAGSLTNLAKFPSSTVQILGAEKALFRALKTKGNTPKYGLIFHCGFIGRAQQKNKGRISRYVANKCSLASRIDCFSDAGSNIFGDKMKDQVEERLRYLTEGVKPRKNLDVMQEAIAELAGQNPKKEKKEKKSKKAKAEPEEEDAAPAKRPRENDAEEEEAPKKKKKKEKKEKAEAVEA